MKLFFVALLASQFAIGALPPLYQSLNEFEAVLNDEGLQDKLTSGRTVSSVQRRKGDKAVYSVRTTDGCSVNATLVFQQPPAGFAGPAQIKEVKTSKLKCRTRR